MSQTAQGPGRLSDGVRGGQWLNLAAIVTWLVCGLPPGLKAVSGTAGRWPATIYLAAYALYGVALLTLLYLRGRSMRRGRFVPVLLLGVESVCALAVIYVGGAHLGGTSATPALIVIVAAQLPYIVRLSSAWTVVALQTLAMIFMFWREAPLGELISLALATGGFQAFATASSVLALSEANAREKLAATNRELQAAQALLAETSRSDERLRISRDLHDTLGHHLTALSLQLDVASRLSEGKAAEHVRQAHAVTRLLLSDVRDVVSTLRETRHTDLTQAIRALGDDVPGLSIHFELPPALGVEDGERAEAVLRCVQEIITNATRHAQARNVWIRIEPRPGGISLQAHDDGRGAVQLALGHGLTGMRERFAVFAGSVEFEAPPGAGFTVRAFMPTPHGAA